MDLTNVGGFNTMINNLMANLIKDINESNLPIGITYYILKDILRSVEQQYNNTLGVEEENLKFSQAETNKENDEN